MNTKKATKIAIHWMQEGMKNYVWGAKRYMLDGSRSPASVRDYESYCEIEEAIKQLTLDAAQTRLNI